MERSFVNDPDWVSRFAQVPDVFDADRRMGTACPLGGWGLCLTQHGVGSCALFPFFGLT